MLAIARSVDSFHQRLSFHDPSLRNDLDFAREHFGIHLNNPLDIRERLLDRVAALFSNQMIDGQDETLFLRLFRSEHGKRQKDRSQKLTAMHTQDVHLQHGFATLSR